MKRASASKSPKPVEVTHLYTADDVAEKFQVSTQTIRRLTYQGLLPCRRIGDRSIRYTDEDLQIYLDRCADLGVA